MNLEKNLKELENIVKQMEENVSMEKSLELFNVGIKFGEKCLNELSETKGKLELLMSDLSKLNLDVEVED